MSAASTAPDTAPSPPAQRSPHIAVVDDESDIRNLLQGYLQSQGLRVSAVPSGTALKALMERDTPDLVLLDLGLPGEDGLAIARELAAQRKCGIVILTGRSHPIDRVLGLEFGADDYITKPFELRELIARIRAVLRRLGQHHPEPLQVQGYSACGTLSFDGWTMNMDSRTLTDPDGHRRNLTSGEFDLLHVLARNIGRVLSRDVLVDRTRGTSAVVTDRTIDVQISRLRKRLEGRHQPTIVGVRNVGYKLVATDDEAHAAANLGEP
jgi:two-component system OmpR family response regulator